MLILVMK